MKLVMTLLVRDEIDIVLDNLDFHFAQGIDHALVIDNGSVDGTREALDAYARRHPVTVIDEPEQNYNQTLWMTRAALQARDTLGADWVLHNDADEFWVSPTGNLKDQIAQTDADILVCPRYNMLCAWDRLGADLPWWEKCQHRIDQPDRVPVSGLPLDAALPCPYFYRSLPPKVMTLTKGLTKVAQGNHSATFEHPAKRAESDIVIYHYPIRSETQLRSKVVNGGASYAANTEFPERVGWHWRRWFAMLKGQGLEAVLADALPDAARLAQGCKDGGVVLDQTIRDWFASRAAPKPGLWDRLLRLLGQGRQT